MNKIKSILAFATLIMCGGAWAKTVAVWDGDLSASTKNGCTMAVDTDNASFSEGKAVLTSSINQARQGLKITWDDGTLPSANVAAFVKYSGYDKPNGNHVLFSVNYDGNKDIVVYAKGDGSGVHCDFSATTGANGTRPGGDVKMPFTFPTAGIMYVEVNATTKNCMFYVAEKTESGYGPFKLAFDYYLKNGNAELSATKFTGIRVGGSIASGGAYYRPAMTVEAVAILDGPLPFKAVYTSDNSNYLSKTTGISMSPNATLADLSSAFFRAQMDGSSVDNKGGWMTAYNTTTADDNIQNQFQMLEGSWVKANIAKYTVSGSKVQVTAVDAKYKATSGIGSDCSSGWNGGTVGSNGYGVKNVTAYVPYENVAFVQGTKNLSELTCLIGSKPTSAEQVALVSIAAGNKLVIDSADFVGTYLVGGAKISAADGVVTVDLKGDFDGVELSRVDFGAQTVKVYDGSTEITAPTTTWESDDEPSSYPLLARDAKSPSFIFASDTINLANIGNSDYIVKGTMKGSWITGKPEATVSVLRDYVEGSDTLAMQVQVYDGSDGAKFTKCQNITFKQATIKGVNYLFATGEKGFYINAQGKDYRGDKITPETAHYTCPSGSDTPYEVIKLTVALNENVMAKIGATSYKTLALAVETANASPTAVEIEVVNAECMEAVEIGPLVTIKMNGDGRTIGAITGSGKVIFDGILPGEAQRNAFKGNAWTGTVVIKNCNTDAFASTSINPGSMANANSDLELDGVAGYIYTDGTANYPNLNCRNLTIGEGGITTKDRFSSGVSKLGFAKLLGSGTITMELDHNGSGYGFFCLIGDASEFSGKVIFNASNAHEVVFAGAESELPVANAQNYTAKNIRVTKGATIKYAVDKFTDVAGWKIDGIIDLVSGTAVEEGTTIISATSATIGDAANVSVAGEMKPYVLEVSEGNVVTASPAASGTVGGKTRYFKNAAVAIEMVGDAALNTIVLLKDDVGELPTGYLRADNGIVKAVAKIGDDRYFATLQAALTEASGATEANPVEIVMLKSVSEDMAIPQYVTVTASFDNRVIGLLTGQGTYKILNEDDDLDKTLENWFSTGGCLANYQGTICFAKGRFKHGSALESDVNLEVTDGGQLWIMGGTWTNLIKVSGEGWTGETSEIGHSALRFDGNPASTAITVSGTITAIKTTKNEREIIPSIGVHNSTAATISGSIVCPNGIQLMSSQSDGILTVSGMINGGDATTRGAIEKIGSGEVKIAQIENAAVKISTGTLRLNQATVGDKVDFEIGNDSSAKLECYGWPEFNGAWSIKTNGDKDGILANPASNPVCINSGSLTKIGGGTATIKAHFGENNTRKYTGTITLTKGNVVIDQTCHFADTSRVTLNNADSTFTVPARLPEGVVVTEMLRKAVKCVENEGEITSYTYSLYDAIKPGDTTDSQETEPTEEELDQYEPMPVNDEAAAAGQAEILKVVAKKINDTQWVITVDLDTEKMPEGKKIDDSALAFAIAGLDQIAGSTTSQLIAVPATAVTPGAYYSVVYGDSPTTMTSEGDRALATSEGVTITVPAMTGKKVQFYRIRASATPTAN